jgi:hypothetical protein
MKKLNTTFGLLGLAAAALAAPSAAEAATVVARAGEAAVASQASCYTGGAWGSVIRNSSAGCPTTTVFWWPLVVENAGSKAMTFTGRGPASCQAVAQNGTQTAASIGSLVAFSSASSFVDTLTSTATVVGGGFLYAQCNTNATAEITRVNWPL